MFSSKELCTLIENGGVFHDVEGQNLEEILTNIAPNVKLPAGIDYEMYKAELLARERILSTAVGNGIAIPHPRKMLISDENDQRVFVCFLKKPLDMNAPDGSSVYALFILLTCNSTCHLKILSSIANLFKNKEFKSLMESAPDKQKLFDAIHASLDAPAGL